MKALSIKQPYAWLIVQGFKDVENRTWPFPTTLELPQRIYVHAGLREDQDAYAARSVLQRELIAKLSMDALGDWLMAPIDLGHGAIVGEVTIFDLMSACIPNGLNEEVDDSPWYVGPYGFVLRDPVAYEKPIPWKGKLGFFEVELPAKVTV